MTETAPEEYFNTDYTLKTVWLGLLWMTLQWTPWTYICSTVGWSNLNSPLDAFKAPFMLNENKYVQHAYNIMMYGHFSIFFGLFVMWLLAYIHEPSL